MLNSFYFKIPRRLRIFAVFLLIILAAYLLVRFMAVDVKTIPEDFLKARQEASWIAKDIIVISTQTTNNINKISDFDKEGKYEEALNLISAELNNNRQAREKAVGLSIQLEAMAKNLSGISPAPAGQLALQAVSSETSLINRLINYNDYMVQLLEILQKKFLGQENNTNKISDLIQKINEEAKAINDLDNNFNKLMADFDKI